MNSESSQTRCSPPPPTIPPEADEILQGRLRQIRQRLVVLSGKGGVGKSTVATNLAFTLAQAGHSVGLLDVDIHGPSVPKLLGLDNAKVEGDATGLRPVRFSKNLEVMSIGFLVNSPESPVIWRGPRKHSLIRQFLRDVNWGPLDYLVVDSPPGTGDESLAVAQMICQPASAVVVTTPQDVAVADVRRSISFCRELSLPVAGVIENMSGFVCPHCGKVTDLFKSGGGESLAREMNVPFLGRVPMDPAVVISGDSGAPFMKNTEENATAQAFGGIVESIERFLANT